MDELVNIPALLQLSDGGTQFLVISVSMVCALIALRNDLGKSGSLVFKEFSEDKVARQSQFVLENCQEKPLGLRL